MPDHMPMPPSASASSTLAPPDATTTTSPPTAPALHRNAASFNNIPAHALSSARPPAPRDIPIYVRIVPNDQWIRLHVPLGATMGSVKDAILTRAKFPPTRPVVLDHLPKAIISFVPSKDLRTLIGIPAFAPPTSSTSTPIKMSAASKAVKLLSRSNNSSSLQQQQQQQKVVATPPHTRTAKQQDQRQQQQLQQQEALTRSPPRHTLSLKDLYGQQLRHAEAQQQYTQSPGIPPLPSPGRTSSSSAQQLSYDTLSPTGSLAANPHHGNYSAASHAHLQPPAISSELHSDSDIVLRTSMSDSASSYVTMDDQSHKHADPDVYSTPLDIPSPSPRRREFEAKRSIPDDAWSAGDQTVDSVQMGSPSSLILNARAPLSTPALASDRQFARSANASDPIDFSQSSSLSSGLLSSSPATTSSALSPGSPSSVLRDRSVSRLSGRRLPSLSALPSFSPSSPPGSGSMRKLTSATSASKLNINTVAADAGTISSSTTLPSYPYSPPLLSARENASEISHGARAPGSWPTGTDFGEEGWPGTASVPTSPSLDVVGNSMSSMATAGSSSERHLKTERRISESSSAILGFSSGATPAASTTTTRGSRAASLAVEPDSPSRPRSRTITAGDAAARAFGALMGRARGKSRAKDKDREKEKEKTRTSEAERKRDLRMIAASQIRSDSGFRRMNPKEDMLKSRDDTLVGEITSSPRSQLTALAPTVLMARRAASNTYPPRAPSTGASRDNELSATAPYDPNATHMGRSSVSNSIDSIGDQSNASVHAGGMSSSTGGWSGVGPSSPDGIPTGESTGFRGSGTRVRRGSVATAASISLGGGGGGANALGAAFDSRRGSAQSSIGSVQSPPGGAVYQADENALEAHARGRVQGPGSLLMGSTISSSNVTVDSEGESPYIGLRQALGGVPRRRRASASAGEGSSPVVRRTAAVGSDPPSADVEPSAPHMLGAWSADGVPMAQPLGTTNAASYTPNSPPLETPASLRGDNTITVSVPESSSRLQQETGAGLKASFANMHLGGIAAEKMSNFENIVSHPLSKAFGLYSYANGGLALDDWKTAAACNLRPWELIELQWCNDGVGIGVGSQSASRIFPSMSAMSDMSSAMPPSASAAYSVDHAFDADTSLASTTITRDTSATFQSNGMDDGDDDELGPLRQPNSQSLASKRSVLDSPGKRPVTAPQGVTPSSSGRFPMGGGMDMDNGDDCVGRTSNDSSSGLNFSSGVTQAVRPGGSYSLDALDENGTGTPSFVLDGPLLGPGAGRVFLPRETWGPGTSQFLGLSRSSGSGVKTIPYDSTYAQPFFESWVYVYKPTAKALGKTQKTQGLGVWKRRWLVICGWRMGLLRKKEGRNLVLGRWLTASSQAANTALTSGGTSGEDGLGLGVGIMTTAGIDVEQGMSGEMEMGPSALTPGAKGQDSSGAAAADASAPASVPTYFLDALRTITTDKCGAPTASNSPTARFEENLPLDRISLAFQPGGSRDPKGFGTIVDPSTLTNDPVLALQSLTSSTSFTSNIGSALSTSGSTTNKTSDNGIMLLHLRCISAHDHTTLLSVLKRAFANKPGANLGAGLFSPSAAAMSTGGAAGVGFASGMTGLGVGIWRRSAVIRATIAGRGGTVQPGKAGRRGGRNSFARMRTRPTGLSTDLDDADTWSTGSEEEGPNGTGSRLKKIETLSPNYHQQQGSTSSATGTSQLPFAHQPSFNSSLRSAVSGGAQKFLRKRPSTSGSFAGSISGPESSTQGYSANVTAAPSSARRQDRLSCQAGGITASPRSPSGNRGAGPESPSSIGFSASRTQA
ncbi:hypothetical protein A4X06_0g2248 [Tilletia controversa]|uniref:Uncharacterized protein n=1 Tax=Tilletia controversa TaxID=13291 RepID=A0A8X7MXZ6_9BASI|nr:hypothetical protein CF328_g1756 [Tilletia controversa]KAE8252352.1 hypothetical protein A4X06_0g2248 [Tilletia controversa]